MANQWFKFYGGEYLSDPKIERLNPTERSCWITLLCLASMGNDGHIEYLTVEVLLNKSGIQFDPYHPEEWESGLGVLGKFKKMNMIEIKDETIIIINWKKRQETAMTGYERVKKHREKAKEKERDNEMITNDNGYDNSRIEENRIEENRDVSFSNQSALEEERKKKPKTPRQFTNQRRMEAGKEPLKTPRTKKQEETFDSLKWKDYFRQQGYEQHGLQFFLVESKKRESAVSKLIIDAGKTGVNLKDLIDWWLGGAGEWAQYEPEQCFMSKTIERFLNKDKKSKSLLDHFKFV